MRPVKKHSPKPKPRQKTPDQKSRGLMTEDQDLLTTKSIQTVPQGGRRQQRRILSTPIFGYKYNQARIVSKIARGMVAMSADRIRFSIIYLLQRS